MQSKSSFVKSKVVKAGAGAGKTTSLISTVCQFVSSYYEINKSYPEVVITTFTNKATQEIKERIILYSKEHFPEYVHYFQSRQIHITTIHGLFDKILRMYGTLVGLNQDFLLLDEIQAQEKKRKIIFKVISEQKKYTKLLSQLSFYEIIEFLNFFDDESINEKKYVDLQYSLKKFDEFINELNAKIDDISLLINSSADVRWHDFIKHINNFKSILEYRFGPEASKFDEFCDLLKKPRLTKNDELSDEFHDEVSQLIKSIKSLNNDLFNPEFWKKQDSVFNLFSDFLFDFKKEIKKQKKQDNWLEISDLEMLMLRLVNENKSFLSNIAEKFNYWMIDEYQDTNPVQEKVLSALVGNTPYYIVGDPQQSIYLFRGAMTDVFEKRVSLSSSLGHEIIEVYDNYRSFKNVLQFINQVFKTNRQSFVQMNPKKDDIDPLGPVRIGIFDDPSNEEIWIEQRLLDIYQEHKSFRGIAFLLRSNDQILKWKSFLINKGFPVEARLAQGFYEIRAIKDVAIILKFILNPWDEVNLTFLLQMPWFYIPPVEVSILKKNFKKNGVIKTLNDFDNILGLKYLGQALSQNSKDGFLKILLEVLTNINFFGFYAEKQDNIFKFLDEIKNISSESKNSIIDYLNNIFDRSKHPKTVEISSSESDKILLLTVHGSKGLEFDYVFIPEMGKKPNLTHFENFTFDKENNVWYFRINNLESTKKIGCFFEKDQYAKQKELEKLENERLLYVALTRAKKNLCLSAGKSISSDSWLDLFSIPLDAGAHIQGEAHFIVETKLPEESLLKSVVFKNFMISPKDILPPLQINLEKMGKGSVTQMTKTIQNQNSKSLRSYDLISRGVKAHKLFELMKNVGRDKISNYILKWFPDEEVEVSMALEFLFNLQTPPISVLLRQGFVETTISYTKDNVLIEGQIDLWGVVEDTLWVVDYKSGSSDYSTQGFDQLLKYSDGLCLDIEIKNYKKVKMALVYPFENKVLLSEPSEIVLGVE